MQTAQGNLLESLRNVKTFLDIHAEQLGSVIKTGTRTSLLAAIADLEGFGNQQAAGDGASKGATKLRAALRVALIHDRMAVVSRIGRAKLPNTPELATLKMPRGNPSDTKLAQAAYEMANTADAHAPVFVEAGLDADFAAQLKKAADAMIGARQQRSMSRVSSATATQGLKAKLTAGRKIVHVLDALVKTALRQEPALLAGWTQAKRVSKVTGLPANGGPAAATPAPSAPTPTPIVAPAA